MITATVVQIPVQVNERECRVFYQPNALAWACFDALAAMLVTWMAFQLSPYSQIALHRADHLSRSACMMSMAILVCVSAHIFGMHDPRAPKDPWYLTTRSLLVTTTSIVGLLLCATAFRHEQVGRYIISQIGLYLAPLLVATRWLFCHGWFKQNINLLVVGTEADKNELAKAIAASQLPIQIQAFTTNPMEAGLLCEQQLIDELVYCSVEQPAKDVVEVLFACQQRNVKLSSIAAFMERTLFRIPHDHIGAQWLLLANFDHVHSVYHAIKRIGDIAISLIALVSIGPIMAMICLLLKLEDSGPVLYSQIRVGRLGKVFRIWKFRTMRVDAEKAGPQWAARGDLRVTRLGSILRKTRLDETPQFWNIIRGDMSFIGPRPERPEFVSEFSKNIPYYEQRHLIKPGLTGWAQINYPYGVGEKDAAAKLQFELYYIKNLSAALDVQIILRTIGAIMKGAR
jgi:exopolysaccharide biosynthesis polyprenyl glycosylphosphotransferase